MSTSAQAAALELFGLIDAPVGAVNTFVYRPGAKGKTSIRVIVEPAYYYRVHGLVPETFKGFHVTVEKRERAYASGL